MIGGSSAPYLARTPCVPLFCTSFNRVGNKERFRLPGAGGGSFPLYGGKRSPGHIRCRNGKKLAEKHSNDPENLRWAIFPISGTKERGL